MYRLWITGSGGNGKRAEPRLCSDRRGFQRGDNSFIPLCPEIINSSSLPSELPLVHHEEKTVSSEKMERLERMEILTCRFFFFILNKCIVLLGLYHAERISGS